MVPLFRIAAALAVVCVTASVQAHDAKYQPDNPQVPELQGLQVGVGVICNSHQQIERYLSAKKETSIQEAIKVVNREVKDNRACGMAMVAFTTGDRTGDIEVSDG